MLVYGDHNDLVCPRRLLEQLRYETGQVRQMAPGKARHSALQSLLIEAGRLEQGVADADFMALGKDCRLPRQRVLAAFTHKLAAALLVSWRSGGTRAELPAIPELPDLPRKVEAKVPEGFAFYAVYPEAFAEAALRLNLSAPPRVIGIRSIGTSLGAVAAAALDAPPSVSVRPFGDPFDRKLEISPALEADLLDQPAHFVIVDEGPGLSGSSFGAVADWLEARGVPPSRIAFLCSHDGPPGSQALPKHRQRWKQTQRDAADFGSRLGSLVGTSARELLGPLDENPRDLSGGKWRQFVNWSGQKLPTVNPMWERRKFLILADGRPWLAKFVGLGREGERKIEIARTLHACGLVPEPLGLANGFLIERWHEDARPLAEDEQPLEEIAAYLGTRARLLPVPRAGSSLDDLLRMARRNAGLSLGSWADERLGGWSSRLERLQQCVISVCVDGKMDRHEWLKLSDGRLLKCDALDHHAAHDAIGCQDLAWDVAGAAVEFSLSPHQTRWLAASVGRAAGRLIDPELLAFMRHAYLAFRLGQATVSADMVSGSDAEQWRERADRLLDALKNQLRDWEPDATRGISSVDQQPERTGAGTILLAQG